MTNPYLAADFHDEDLHNEWLRLSHEALSAAASGDEDLRDSLTMQLQQVEEAIHSRQGRRLFTPARAVAA